MPNTYYKRLIGAINMYSNILEFIKSNRNLLDLITDLVPIPLFIKDRSGLYIDCNSAFSKFLSISREEIIGKSVYDIWSKDEADVFRSQDNALFEQGGLQIYEAKISSANGIQHLVQLHKQVFTDSSGIVTGFLGAIVDITEKKKLENALAQQAATDELTGLPNRREGLARLEILYKDSEKTNRPYCIAMGDIDHFKQVNDQYGHNNGDLVLKAFSHLAMASIRSSDVCFRYGGEEFVILLPETSLEDGFDIVERLRKAWSCTEISLSDSQVIHSTISFGLVQFPIDGIAYEQMLPASDRALYDAKNSGRNKTVCRKPD